MKKSLTADMLLPDHNVDRDASMGASVSRRSGLLAQFMVLLNGLIITITAFVTLNLFITDMNNKEVSDTVRRIEQTVLATLTEQNGAPVLNWETLRAEHSDLRYLKIASKGSTKASLSYGAPSSRHIEIERSFIFANQQWRVIYQMAVRDGHAILGYVPILMLFFGLTLTLIGVLFVRSNQKQALRLQEMNKQLRDKNRDIRRQMGKNEQIMASLQASERDFSAIINSVNEIIFEVDQSGRIVFLNDAWDRLTDIDIGDALGKPLLELIYPQDTVEINGAIRDVFFGNVPNYRALTRVKSNNGQYRFVEILLSLTRIDHAGNRRLVGMMTDIEERRQVEIMLRETEKRYRNIVENAVSGLYQVAGDGRFISANPALARLLGYTSPELMLNDVMCNKNALFHDPKDRDLLMRLVKRQGQVKAFEVKYKRTNGDVIWVSESVRVVHDQSGEITYYEGALDDITQRKEAEIAMQKARLESDLANRGKTEFLQNMSHELRTPLNAIIGFSDIIHQESLGMISEKAYLDYAREINAGGKQLLRVINEILDVSRIELGTRPDHEDALDMNKICDSCISMVRGKAEEKLIVIESNIPTQMPIIVGSETAFKQMVLNLLHNAMKYTPQGGHIVVEAILDQDHSIRLSVADNGAGMDHSLIKLALHPLDDINGMLQQDERARQETFSLSLVRSLIAQHDGRLEILSEKGVGTTAILIIPASRVVGILDKNGVFVPGKQHS